MTTEDKVQRPETQAPGTICFDGKYFRVATKGRNDPAVDVIRSARQRRWSTRGKWWWMAKRIENKPALNTLVHIHGYKISDEAHTQMNDLGMELPLDRINYVQPEMHHSPKEAGK